MGIEELRLVPSGKTIGRAITPQEYYYYTHQQDPDPRSICLTFLLHLTGTVDRELLVRAVQSFVRHNSVYRTVFRVIDGDLYQEVLPMSAVPELEVPVYERPSETIEDRDRDIKAVIDELLATPFDISRPEMMRPRLVVHAPERHTLMLALHHLVWDEHVMRTIADELFRHYNLLREGGPTMAPPLQYIDYTEAVHHWPSTSTGSAQQRYWANHLANAAPLDLKTDTPRDAFSARRASVPLGLTAEAVLPPHVVEVPAELKEAVKRVASEEGTTSNRIYLAMYARLLSEMSSQSDICIESAYQPWEARRAETHGFQGMLTTWTMFRVDMPLGVAFRDAVRRTDRVVKDGLANGIIVEYYKLTNNDVRRVSFQDHGMTAPPMTTGGYVVSPGLHCAFIPPPFPSWKKPWEYHLSLYDRSDAPTTLMWTASPELFRRETVVRNADRYLEMLAEGTRA